MKKIIDPITLVALAAILFSSCSNSSKLAFTKRHYRSGNFVDHIGKVNTKENPVVARVPAKTKRVSSSPVIANSSVPVAISTPIIASQNSVKVEHSAIQWKSERIAPVAINSLIAAPNVPTFNSSANGNSNNEEEYGGHERVDANVSFAVVVLCAIFIPPLGVALAYGINSYFWIDLILTLIFFFPGMIFALIVVLS